MTQNDFQYGGWNSKAWSTLATMLNSTRSTLWKVDKVDRVVLRLNVLNSTLLPVWTGPYTLQCGTIMTLISPSDCTLQCGMWLWNRDSEFTKWQHPAV